MTKGAKLTEKQRRFVEAYDGNGTAAARAAGYRGSYGVLSQVAHENLRKPEVRKAIDARLAPAAAERVNTRAQRQGFWTRIMDDPEADLAARLRASELLGKSEADFIEKHEHDHKGNVTIVVGDPYAKKP